MIEIDGSSGEGGGQVLRSALSLSMVTGQAFRIERVRAGRKRPGLARQHLAAVRAAAEVSSAEVGGAALGSQALSFRPGAPAPGHYHFDVGTAGSATLVLQTVLPALLTAAGPSTLVAEGGTHNPHAPPFDFLEKAYLPLLERLGPRLRTRLVRPGFYPAGGGRIELEVEPVAGLEPFELLERGKVRARRARALVSALPRHIAERELKVVMKKLSWDAGWLEVEEVAEPRGPGNVLLLEVRSENVCELFTGFGEIRVPAEKVAARTVSAVRRYLKAGMPVGEHLADQLLLPLALAGGGAFATLPLSRHATTQIELLRRFLDVTIEVEDAAAGVVVRISGEPFRKAP